MATKDTSKGLESKNIIRVVVGTLLLLSVPLMAMVFNWPMYDPGNPVPERLNWSPFDFIVMGILLLITGFAFELLAKRFQNTAERIIVAVIVVGLFFLIWAELAVGIFGTPLAGS
ncbi:MAG TPA: hypothetical protein VFM68_00105 [Candidatus Saccharimonadales bacterium]|nr:hypothetical protein [Candidatus Saccharimonadales bacterium]